MAYYLKLMDGRRRRAQHKPLHRLVAEGSNRNALSIILMFRAVVGHVKTPVFLLTSTQLSSQPVTVVLTQVMPSPCRNLVVTVNRSRSALPVKQGNAG